MQQYKTISIQQKSPNSRVFHLYLNRPSKINSFSYDFFAEFPAALSSLDENPDVGAIILAGIGNHFSSGIDMEVINSIMEKSLSKERGRGSEWFRREVKYLQAALTAVERCRKPVIASIHGYCVGGGLDLVTACDIRFCTKDAVFSVKEVDLAIVADMGTLQRLPPLVGYGKAVELAMTGRKFSGQEAMDMGLVSRVFESKEALDEGVVLLAEGIGAKSPLALAGIKEVMLRSKDLTLEQALDYVATWDSAMVLSDDMKVAFKAHLQKTNPVFAKL
ncbi:delta(3,5)-Delta(2,4)-dienoyl-CoA isomerase, peroxisomal-like [Euphorbia lathyris]|uniref:delta(3,5)-Delta(2,4)-dienoyl-CoA isomerase, peroxisomal-like n=1 Tax=Euphorbia lathyris TaxID=212925 RepID=UPI0033144F17